MHRNLVLLFLGLLPCVNGLWASVEKTVLVHYMPWFSTKTENQEWGWHWTMNHRDPDLVKWDGTREIASHDYPLIGLYDSGDEWVLECQVQQMKLAGIDGVIIDWYGIDPINDYPMIHENTELLVSIIKKAGLQFAICYEDRSIKQAIKNKLIEPSEAVSQARKSLNWLARNWFTDPSYYRIKDKPALLVFGPLQLTGEVWSETIRGLEPKPLTFALPHLTGGSSFDSAFAWIPVKEGKRITERQWKVELESVYQNPEVKVPVIPVAFPGYRDFYEQAKIGPSYGAISDQEGKTWEDSLDIALGQKSPLVQIATWNDYGEGTVIEPTRSRGYRYIETLSEKLGSSASLSDLSLPSELLRVRKRTHNNSVSEKALEQVSVLLFSQRCEDARQALAQIKEKEREWPAYFADGPGKIDPNYLLLSDLPYLKKTQISGYAEGRCRLDLYAPAKGKNLPTVIWFHGGGITKGYRSIPLPLRKQEIIVIAANYRLSPRVKAPVYIEDAAAVVAWAIRNVHRFGGSPDSIFVSGHSAGGYLASMVGMDSRFLKAHDLDPERIAGLIPFSGHTITHFTIRKERGIPWQQAVVDEFAPLYHTKRKAPPILLITGDRELELYGRYEETAYFWRMMKKAGHPDVHIAEMKNHHHGNMPIPSFPLLLEFVRQRCTP